MLFDTEGAARSSWLRTGREREFGLFQQVKGGVVEAGGFLPDGQVFEFLIFGHENMKVDNELLLFDSPPLANGFGYRVGSQESIANSREVRADASKSQEAQPKSKPGAEKEPRNGQCPRFN